MADGWVARRSRRDCSPAACAAQRAEATIDLRAPLTDERLGKIERCKKLCTHAGRLCIAYIMVSLTQSRRRPQSCRRPRRCRRRRRRRRRRRDASRPSCAS